MMKDNTNLGYNPYDVMSALQKCIRRGKEEEALFFAFELIDSGLQNIVTSRLKVISHEDVGIADPNKILLINQCVEDFKQWYPKNAAWRLAITNAVIYLCRADKSRDSDNLQAHIQLERHKGKTYSIPDVAYDDHTLKGKKMGRGKEFFVSQSTQLEPDKSKADIKDKGTKAFLEADKQKIDLSKPATKPKKSKDTTLF